MHGPPGLGLGVGLTTHRKNKLVTKDHKKPQAWRLELNFKLHLDELQAFRLQGLT
jgi:hypothetical protein